MVDSLRTAEQNSPEQEANFLIISAGTAEESMAVKLHSPIVLDPSFSAGRACGASDTPSAVFIDATGKVGSRIFVGTQAVVEIMSTLQRSARYEPAAL
jgi:hypothetical protein